MMKIAAFIDHLKTNHGVTLRYDGKALKVGGAKGVVQGELLQQLKARKAELVDYLEDKATEQAPIAQAAYAAHGPVSSAQKRLYFLQQLHPQSTVYNLPQAVRFGQNLDQQQLLKALQGVVNRHEALRTVFYMQDLEVKQQFLPEVPVALEQYEVGTEGLAKSLQAAIRPFNLQEGPLFRFMLFKQAGQGTVLFVDLHHIIADGVSQQVLLHDFLALYLGKTLPPLPCRYLDYVNWQANKEGRAYLKEYWTEEFADLAEPFALNTDHARPAASEQPGQQLQFTIDAPLTQKLTALANQQGATMFSVLLSAYFLLLHKITGKQDVVLGIPVMGREHNDLKPLVGMFVNAIPVRFEVEPNQSVAHMLAGVQAKVLDLLNYQAYPFEALINDLKLTRDTSRNPLYDVFFAYHDYEDRPLAMEHLDLAPVAIPSRAAKFDLSMIIRQQAGGLQVEFEYASALFNPDTIGRFKSFFVQLLHQLVANEATAVAALDFVPKAEKALVAGFNTCQQPQQSNQTLVQVFRNQVAQTPRQTALRMAGQTVDFKAYDQMSDQVAHYLAGQCHIQKGDPVGVLLTRELQLLPVIFGILKAGAVYVPIDPAFPKQRVLAIVDDTQMKVFISRKHLAAPLQLTQPELVDLDSQWAKMLQAEKKHALPEPAPEDLAYIIFTSGSTGRPKGVMIEHHSVVNRIAWMQQQYPITAQDVILQKTPLVFDVSVWELFWGVFTGATLELLPPGGEKEPETLINCIEQGGVTTMHFVPSMLDGFLAYTNNSHLEQVKTLKQVFVSGEALKLGQVQQFKKLLNQYNGTRLINLYGPTEATVDVSYYECQFDETQHPPIGQPIANTQLYVLDSHHQVLPVGVPGELYIGGVGVARGYIAREDLTNERFVPNPFTGEGKMYKTGDLARWRADGNIIYLGRIDSQVKISQKKVVPFKSWIDY